MLRPYLLISLTTCHDTAGWGVGKKVLDTICVTDKSLKPEFVANAEPIKIPFVSIDECEKAWAPSTIVRGLGIVAETKLPFLWKRESSVKHYGHVIHTAKNLRGELNLGRIIMRADADRKLPWLDLFRDLCAIVKPKYGMLHIFAEPELVKAEFKSAQSSFQIGPAGWSLESSIPNLGWASFLGDKFSAEVEVPKLVKSGVSTEAINEGYLFNLTDDLFDVLDNFEDFSRRRAQIKKLFRNGLFQIEEEPIKLERSR